MEEVSSQALVLSVLAVWRLTHLLSQEDGPFDFVFRIRKMLGTGFFGSLLDCFLCLSLWISIPFALLLSQVWLTRSVLWLAISGASSILFLWVRKAEAPTP